MKKLAIVSAIYLLSYFSNGYAEDRIWRSTEPVGGLTNVLLTTGVVMIKDITVIYGSDSFSSFRYFNSSTTDLSVTRSSSSVFDTSKVGSSYPIEEYLSDGFLFTKVGTSTIHIRWDYVFFPQTGRENIGYK